MSVYERLNIAITEIHPDSASKVFAFIKKNFDNNLDKEFFKDNFMKYNAGEQHLICLYLKNYINSSRYNTFNNWLRDKQLEYEKNGIEQEYFEFEELISCNRDKLLSILDSRASTALRRFKLLKKHKIPYNHYFDEISNLEKTDFKIPLYFKPTILKKFIVKAMTEIVSKEQAEAFFFNSFEYGNNIGPTKFLNIEVTDRTLLTEQISIIKAKYDQEYKFQLQKKKEQYNKRNRNKKFTAKLEFKKPTAIDFAKIVYNSFPEIRDVYFTKNFKKPEYTLNKYLTNYTKNFIGIETFKNQ